VKLHHLRPAPGSTKDRVRKGRGDASGKGKTAGRGTKGSKARRQIRVGFEGGPRGGGIDPDGLVAAGLARKGTPVKILGHGDVSVALEVRAHAFSATAASKITAAGGTVEVV